MYFPSAMFFSIRKSWFSLKIVMPSCRLFVRSHYNAYDTTTVLNKSKVTGGDINAAMKTATTGSAGYWLETRKVTLHSSIYTAPSCVQ